MTREQIEKSYKGRFDAERREERPDRRLAGEGPRGRADHDRRVRRLRVPALRRGRADARQGRREPQERRPDGLQVLSAAEPPARGHRGARGRRGDEPGQVLGDAPRALHEPAPPRADGPRQLREGARARGLALPRRHAGRRPRPTASRRTRSSARTCRSAARPRSSSTAASSTGARTSTSGSRSSSRT